MNSKTLGILVGVFLAVLAVGGIFIVMSNQSPPAPNAPAPTASKTPSPDASNTPKPKNSETPKPDKVKTPTAKPVPQNTPTQTPNTTPSNPTQEMYDELDEAEKETQEQLDKVGDVIENIPPIP